MSTDDEARVEAGAGAEAGGTMAATGDRGDHAGADRAAALRVALRRLVARRGFHGTSMGAIAAEAGVAAGTAYVHYRSKDDLVIATYVEVKHDLGRAAVERFDPERPVADQFRCLWLAIHDHLDADRDRARFLVQLGVSPYAPQAHAAALQAVDDPLLVLMADSPIGRRLAPLPLAVLYDLGIGAAVRLAASSVALPAGELDAVADACWRAISVDQATGHQPAQS